MAKEIIDAVKEAELNGRYKVENAKDEAKNRVMSVASELASSEERKIELARKEADELISGAEAEVRGMIEKAEAEALKEREELWKKSSGRMDKAQAAVIKYLFD